MKHKKGNNASYGVSSYSSCDFNNFRSHYKPQVIDTLKVSMKKNTISTFDTVFTKSLID